VPLPEALFEIESEADADDVALALTEPVGLALVLDEPVGLALMECVVEALVEVEMLELDDPLPVALDDFDDVRVIERDLLALMLRELVLVALALHERLNVFDAESELLALSETEELVLLLEVNVVLALVDDDPDMLLDAEALMLNDALAEVV
jgi:hypothetical protein